MTGPEPSNGSLIVTFADCPDRDLGVCNVYCGAWKRAGYAGSHPACYDIVTGNIQHNVDGIPYFRCPQGFSA